MVYRDINPQAPVHFLVIPKNRDGLTQLSKCSDRHEPLLGHLIRVASKVALQGELACLHALLTMPYATQSTAWHRNQTESLYTAEGCEKGFRTVINDGPEGCKFAVLAHSKWYDKMCQ